MKNIVNSNVYDLAIKRAKLESTSRIFLGIQFIVVAFLYFSLYSMHVSNSISLFLPLLLILSISLFVFLSNTISNLKDFFESLIAPIVNISLVLFLINIMTFSSNAVSVVKNESMYSLKNIEVVVFITLIAYGLSLITIGIVRLLNTKKDIKELKISILTASILSCIIIPIIILMMFTNSIPLVTILISSSAFYLIYHNNKTWMDMYSISNMKLLDKNNKDEQILITTIDKKSFDIQGMKFEPQDKKGLIVGGLLGSIYLMTSIFDFYFGMSNMFKNQLKSTQDMVNMKITK